ncbi:PoNe immunity protein domain-containing protein [Acinetobacter stercoris]|uniref:PoNi C-terminal domain-containing protein n=1 Tax=Acinetobacter stercoris TaxID=2126983 RepID=A0A2U3MTZ3_9GAMM|nr:PoNe immunity protein domain-containing protein [Acinetobacter stercoris]SPL68908.1 hypothetical protein KPC_0086 [Acinetobacter stercoris]
MENDLNIDWQQWFETKNFDSNTYRDSLMTDDLYNDHFEDLFNGIYSVTDGFLAYQNTAKPSDLMVSGRRRIIDVLDFFSLQYSCGANINIIKNMYSYLLDWVEQYAEVHKSYHLSKEAEGRFVWHIALGTEDYWYIALRLICFGLLTGYADQMSRIMLVIDYREAESEGQEKDGLLERLVEPFVADRGIPPDEARRHLPYRKLFKVFSADSEQRPALMLQYLDDWYEASRREPYHDQHPQADIRSGISYYGYWSWEAAAVTWLLDIDDSLYREHQFYPKDLVDFARAQSSSQSQEDLERLKVKGGDKALRTGYWTTPARPNHREYIKQGDILPTLSEADWGEVYWHFDGEG